ncbi:MAG: response regulator [Deltaproteobacteria bacterium]|nr:response regulator [Deltaproteobacteria bacterium]
MDILLIDDERSIRETLASFLTDIGHDVRTAFTGEDGLWALDDRPADLVLTDVKMPGISGLEVLQRVRESWPGSEVVLITGYAAVEDAVEALRRGAYDFLLKPVRLAHLEAVVRRCDERIRFARDNRELRGVVERLQELNERKEKFIALANHELRTPTTVAAGLASLLASRGDLLAPEIRDLVHRVDGALRRMREVVEDLGDLALTQSGGLTLRLSAEPVAAYLGDLNAACASYETLRKVSLEVQCAVPEDLVIEADRRKLVRALEALIQNAVKFTPDGGYVWVRLLRNGPGLRFEVEDTGVGVPETEAQKIFDLFYEVADTRHHRTSGHEFQGGGLGVGLPLAAAIARAHGGEISHRKGREQGSVFELTVPLGARAAG